ncbi:hypothetical protein F4775DRAFT_580817 [Biscogniauxia sp. FL1348]|nr:hypothetical protein F4775DRAFT_580817 [Biscogniauxia sp. FL1348]
MMFNAIIGAIFTAATVSGAALRPRQATFFNVTDFHASCIPHSLLCSYEFDVVAQSSMFPTSCSLMLQGPDILPTVDQTACENSAYAWSVATSNGTLALSVTTVFNGRMNLTGTHIIPTGELIMEQNGASISQKYTGPTGFLMNTVGTPRR